MGIDVARYRLSLPGEGGKYVATSDMWRHASQLLGEAFDQSRLAYEHAAAIQLRDHRIGALVHNHDTSLWME